MRFGILPDLKSFNMKKSLLLFSFLLSAAWCGAQSFSLTSYGVSISNHPDSLLHSTAVLHNNSANTIDVRVDKIENSLAGMHFAYFCWAGQCYDSTAFQSPFTTPMGPGDSSIAGTAGFIAYLNPQSTLGHSEVTYCFYDDLNTADSACITFNYSAIIAGIKELIASGVSLTQPVPNPANAFTQIGFNLAPSKSAKLVVYNMLGLAVKEIQLNDKQKLVALNTADLKNGLYIYSLYSNDKIVASKKLVVNHR